MSSFQNEDAPSEQTAEHYLSINLPSHGMPTTAQVAGFAEAEEALLLSMGGAADEAHSEEDDGLGLPSIPVAKPNDTHLSAIVDTNNNNDRPLGPSITYPLSGLQPSDQHAQTHSAITAPTPWQAFAAGQADLHARSSSADAVRGHAGSGGHLDGGFSANAGSDVNFGDFSFNQAQPNSYMQLPESYQGIPTSITVSNTNDPQQFNQSQASVDPLQPAFWAQFPSAANNQAPPKLSLDTGFDSQGYQQHRREHTGSVSSVSSQSSYASFSEADDNDLFAQGLHSTSSSSEYSNLFTPATANGQGQLGVLGQLQDMTVHSRSSSMVSLDRSTKKKTPYSRSKSGSGPLGKRTSTSSLSEQFDANSMGARGSPLRKNAPRGGLVRHGSNASFRSNSVDEREEDGVHETALVYNERTGEEAEGEDDEEQPGGDNYRAPITRWAGEFGNYGEDLNTVIGGPVVFMRSGAEREAEVDSMLLDMGKVADQMRSNAARDKARQDWSMKWLNLSYDHWESCSVNRQGLYRAYTESCGLYNVKPLNTASFGKLLKQQFGKNVIIRRLGNRSCSKYHYCGLRPITKRQADMLNKYTPQSNGIYFDVPEGRMACMPSRETLLANDQIEPMSLEHLKQMNKAAQASSLHGIDSGMMDLKTPTPSAGFGNPAFSSMASEGKKGRRANGIKVKQEELNEIELENIAFFPDLEAVADRHATFRDRLPLAEQAWEAVKSHFSRLLVHIKGYRFDSFEMECRQFWSTLEMDHSIFGHPVMMQLVGTADAAVYDEIFTSLSANFLGTLPPVTQVAMKSLGEKMEKIMVESLSAYDTAFFDRKIESAARFGHLLRHYHDILQTTASLKVIMSKPDQVKSMAQAALHDIQWAPILDHAALVLDIHPNALEQTFVASLQAVLKRSFASLSQAHGGKNNGNTAVLDLSIWASQVAETFLADQRLSDGMYLKGMMVNFCWLTTQLVRDLTLRSDPTFGLFQMLKVFVDDWVGLLVLRRTSLSDASVSSSVSVPLQQDFAGYSDFSLDAQMFPQNAFAGPSGLMSFDLANPMDTSTPSANNQNFNSSRDGSQTASEYIATTASWTQGPGPSFT